MERLVIILSILFVLTILIIFYNHILIIEKFQVISTPTQGDTSKCFGCMDFYSEANNMSDATAVVKFIEEQDKFTLSFFNKCDEFFSNKTTLCQNVDSLEKFVECMNSYLRKTQCPSSFDILACNILIRWVDDLINKSLLCSTTKCSIEEFEKNFKKNLDKMKTDFDKCRTIFNNPDNGCINLIIKNIESKIASTNSSKEDEKLLISKRDLNEQLFKTNSFIGQNL